MATGDHVALGRRGEEIAARYLAGRGFRILERRFKTRSGEIDLVAEEAGTLAFIEVKTRSSSACGRPAEAVDRRKQARLARAAEVYLARTGRHDAVCRFDVVEVWDDPDGECRIDHIRDAF
ncbi:MAG TPA: YraN family protein [Candidatus Polarisedimenticolia bacterium]|nr:YraN family protein [Candidatus Polarisedimenticolia bacterium]